MYKLSYWYPPAFLCCDNNKGCKDAFLQHETQMVSVCDPARIHHQHTPGIATRLHDGPLQPICLHLKPTKGFKLQHKLICQTTAFAVRCYTNL